MKSSSFSPGTFIFLLFLFSCTSSNTGTAVQPTSEEAPQLKSVLINGDSIHYVEMGSGAPVVFVHGSLGDYRSWGAQLDTFSKKYHIIAYSRRFAYPNNSKVTDSSDFSVTAHAKDLVEFLKVLNLGPVHLVGHSYGAFTALVATMQNPELVKTLTLGEAPVMPLLQNVPGGDSMLNRFMTGAMIPAGEEFEKNDSIRAIQIFVGGVMGDSTYYSKLPEMAHTIMSQNVPEMRGATKTKNPFPPVTCEDLMKIKQPVLLVMGEKSPQLFVSISHELERCLPVKETATLPNTSHGLQFENPVAFNQALMRFLEKN